MFNQDKTGQDKDKCQQNRVPPTQNMYRCFFHNIFLCFVFTSNTLTYSTLRFCPYASNNGVNLIKFYIVFVFIRKREEEEVEVKDEDIQKE